MSYCVALTSGRFAAPLRVYRATLWTFSPRATIARPVAALLTVHRSTYRKHPQRLEHTMRKKASRFRAPRAPQSAAACSHCGTNRAVATLSTFVGFQRRFRMPGMDAVLFDMSSSLHPDTEIAFCPGCGCTAIASLGSHTH